VPVPSQDKLGGLQQKGIWRKNGGGDGGGSLISSDGVAPIQIVGVSASVIFPCTIKSRRFLLAPAQAGSPGKRAVKWLCVRVRSSSFLHHVGSPMKPTAVAKNSKLMAGGQIQTECAFTETIILGLLMPKHH